MKVTQNLLVTTIFALVALILAGCEGAEGRKDKYMEQAQASFADADYEKAKVSYKNVLQIDPRDLAGNLGLAETLEKMQDWRGAASRYRYALELDPENISAKLRLGRLLFAAQAPQEALKHAEEVLLKEPQNGRALTLKAGVYSQQGKIEDAIDIAHEAYELTDEKGDTAIVLARLYVQKGWTNKSINILVDELKREPDQPALQTLLIGLYENTGDFYNAEIQLKKLVETKPDVLSYKVALSDFYQRQGRLEDAEQLIIDAIKSEPDLIDAKIAHSRLYRRGGDTAKAERILSDYIAEDPEAAALYFELAQFYFADEKYTEAKDVYDNLLSQSDLNIENKSKARNRIALIYIKEDNIDAAEELVGEVLEENVGNIEALKIRGNIAFSKKDAINAIADFRAVLGANPSEIDVIKRLAKAHILNNEPDLAVEQLKIVSQVQPKDTETNLLLAKIHAATGDVDQAIKHYTRVYDANSDNERVKLELARLLMADKRWDEAELLISEHIKTNPKDAKGYYFLGLAYQNQQRHEDAIKQFELSLEEMPTAVEPMSAKVRSLVAVKQFDEGIEWLEGLTKSYENSAAAHNLLGELYASQKQTKKAIKSLKAASDIKPEWWVPYRTLSSIHANEKQKDKSIKVLKDGIKVAQSKEQLRTQLASVYEADGKHDDAIDQYEKMVSENGKNLRNVNNLAMLLVTYREDDASLNRAAELAEKIKTSTNPMYMDTAAWVHYKRGEYELAMPIIKRAAEQVPNSPVIQYHLARTYYSINDKENARRHLEKALETEKKFPEYEEAVALLEEMKKQG